MGMDYKFAGSASYPRFNEELREVAKIFGGTKPDKFIFPDGTNEILVKWFNDIYGDFTVEETKIVWEHISQHPEIKDISNQIWHELEFLTNIDEEWNIW